MNLATSVLASSLLVVHDAHRGGEDEVSGLTGGQQGANPLLNVADLDVKARGDDTALVDAAVVHDLELANVAVLLHDLQELNHDLGDGAKENLALSALLGVGHALKAVGKHRHLHHVDEGVEKGREGGESESII